MKSSSLERKKQLQCLKLTKMTENHRLKLMLNLLSNSKSIITGNDQIIIVEKNNDSKRCLLGKMISENCIIMISLDRAFCLTFLSMGKSAGNNMNNSDFVQ